MMFRKMYVCVLLPPANPNRLENMPRGVGTISTPAEFLSIFFEISLLLTSGSHRSEGEAERDIGSTCMIGPGLVVVEKFFRRRRRRRRRHLGADLNKLGFYMKIYR